MKTTTNCQIIGTTSLARRDLKMVNWRIICLFIYFLVCVFYWEKRISIPAWGLTIKKLRPRYNSKSKSKISTRLKPKCGGRGKFIMFTHYPSINQFLKQWNTSITKNQLTLQGLPAPSSKSHMVLCPNSNRNSTRRSSLGTTRCACVTADMMCGSTRLCGAFVLLHGSRFTFHSELAHVALLKRCSLCTFPLQLKENPPSPWWPSRQDSAPSPPEAGSILGQGSNILLKQNLSGTWMVFGCFF